MESFSASQFCQTLFQNIKNGGEDKDREQVGAGYNPSTSSTLLECGIDLTQQACENKLDPM